MNLKIKLIATTAAIVLAGTVAQADDAKALYEKSCAACHGKDGKGKKTKDYTDAKVQESLKDEDMIKTIKEGVRQIDR